MPLSQDPRLFVVGDSHALYCFAGLRRALIYWLGPLTMYRIGRDGVDSVLPRRLLRRLRAGDLVALSFGEIDCRNHIEKIATRTHRTTDAVIDELAARFLLAIVAFKQTYRVRAGVSCVAPPAPTPASPEAAVQARIRVRLNRRLQEAAAGAGLSFIDFYAAYADANGFLRCPDPTKVHIDPTRTEYVAAALNRSFGTNFEYRQISRDVFLYGEVASRRRAKWAAKMVGHYLKAAAARARRFLLSRVRRDGK